MMYARISANPNSKWTAEILAVDGERVSSKAGQRKGVYAMEQDVAARQMHPDASNKKMRCS